ncbi:MAG: Fic family protein [Candidatus Kaiserbacteria bacterium]|nr:Fic family protein [Candidatus Kaiserbacteria bacterium]
MDSANKKNFKEIPLKLYEPAWGSDLASVILELEQLRVKQLGGPVPPYIFFQLKDIFQMLESLGSARIEGNRTTLAEFVERVIERKDNPADADEQMREIANIEKAITFIEEQVHSGTQITRAILSEIHKIIVEGLQFPPKGEGSKNPGQYRSIPVVIQKSNHVPPEPVRVPEYMEELFNFVNTVVESKNDLLVTALAHHRAAWIHPYDNGNGRAIRMFTYALLIKQGFAITDGRILNPTAIFCNDRQRYYDMLELADSGEPEKVLEWCEYVLKGLRDEIKKIDRLLDYKYITLEVLMPALSFAKERQFITEREHAILEAVVTSDDMAVKSSDIEKVIGEVSSVHRSRIIRGLREKGMLMSLKEGGRVYTIGFMNNYLLRAVMYVLENEGFVPASLNNK